MIGIGSCSFAHFLGEPFLGKCGENKTKNNAVQSCISLSYHICHEFLKMCSFANRLRVASVFEDFVFAS